MATKTDQRIFYFSNVQGGRGQRGRWIKETQLKFFYLHQFELCKVGPLKGTLIQQRPNGSDF